VPNLISLSIEEIDAHRISLFLAWVNWD